MSNRSVSRVLRVTGLPPEMAAHAVHSVLRAERSVRAIDVIEGAPGAASSSVFVIVEPDGLARVHRKIATGFTGIEIEDVTRLGASAYVARAKPSAALQGAGAEPETRASAGSASS